MSLLQFIAFLGREIVELYTHYRANTLDDETAKQIAMRMARRVSDEIALREIGKP